MKPEWEMKEEVLLNIAWDRPEKLVAFDIYTIDDTLRNCVTLKQTQDGWYFILHFDNFLS